MKKLLLTWMCGFISLLHTYEAIVGSSRIYVPEEHFLFLVCRRGSDVEWTHRTTRVNTTKYRSGESPLDQGKYQLLLDGTLLIRDLEETDSGLYYCNGRLVAEVTILTGGYFVVAEGSTLYLPCSFAGKPKQRWAYRHTSDTKKEYISTMFKNRTLTQERDDPDGRFIHTYSHLLIINLQLSDSGIYLCSGHEVATVLVVQTERKTCQPPTTEPTEAEDNSPEKSENVTLVILLVISVLAVVLVTLCLKFVSREKQPAVRLEETELQLQKTNQDLRRSPGDEEHSEPLTNHTEVQYASLGRQNWRARGWTQDSQQQVIYSTLLLNPSSPLTSPSITQKL